MGYVNPLEGYNMIRNPRWIPGWWFFFEEPKEEAKVEETTEAEGGEDEVRSVEVVVTAEGAERLPSWAVKKNLVSSLYTPEN